MTLFCEFIIYRYEQFCDKIYSGHKLGCLLLIEIVCHPD